MKKPYIIRTIETEEITVDLYNEESIYATDSNIDEETVILLS